MGRFVDWCGEHYLHINVPKTKEIVLDPRVIGNHSSVAIHRHDIEQVANYKYLGVHIDSELSWHTHVASVCVRIHQQLYFFHRLRFFGVCRNVMLILLTVGSNI